MSSQTIVSDIKSVITDTADTGSAVLRATQKQCRYSWKLQICFPPLEVSPLSRGTDPKRFGCEILVSVIVASVVKHCQGDAGVTSKMLHI